jgi:hypothetical protein
VANYLLRGCKVVPSKECASPYMLYDLARRYDEATVRATLARILGRGQVRESIRFGSTGAGKRARRELLMQSARG